MKYTIEVGNWGAECVAGAISDKIWKYIQDECDGDADEYAEKLNSGEVPEEFKLAEDVGSFYDAGSFFQYCLPYADTDIAVNGEEHNEVLKCCLKDLKQEVEEEVNEPKDCRRCFVWRSVEKSTWIASRLIPC